LAEFFDFGTRNHFIILKITLKLFFFANLIFDKLFIIIMNSWFSKSFIDIVHFLLFLNQLLGFLSLFILQNFAVLIYDIMLVLFGVIRGVVDNFKYLLYTIWYLRLFFLRFSLYFEVLLSHFVDVFRSVDEFKVFQRSCYFFCAFTYFRVHRFIKIWLWRRWYVIIILRRNNIIWADFVQY